MHTTNISVKMRYIHMVKSVYFLNLLAKTIVKREQKSECEHI